MLTYNDVFNKKKIDKEYLTTNKIIDLAGYELTEIPDQIFLNPYVQALLFGKDNYLPLGNNKKIITYKNKISKIPTSISRLTRLQKLDLSDNKLEAIPLELGELQFLKYLDLSNNNIKIIPKEIIALPSLSELKIGGNPIEFPPPEIVNQGISAMRTWLAIYDSGEEKAYLTEIKLIFIGDSGVGKTTICENLINPNYKLSSHPSTHGLDFKKWETKITFPTGQYPFKYNLWDFGGQGKYRIVQQLFCTKNSIYILVTDTGIERLDNDKYSQYDYWLSMANAFGYDPLHKNYSPTIFVQNKIDKIANDYKFSEEFIKQHFPGVTNIIKTSCETSEGLSDLMIALGKQLHKTRILKDPFSQRWINVRQVLLGYTNKVDTIPYDLYSMICNENGMNKDEAEIWLSYLVTIGAVLYFPNIDQLEDQIIINPNWAKEIAYKVLDSELLIKNNGKFTKDDFALIWGEQPKGQYIRFISLLKAFELCYESMETDVIRFYIPALFQTHPIPIPEEIFERNHMIFEYSFENFFPAGMLNRIIVRLHRLIYNNIYWANGALLKKGSHFCLVEENWKDKKIIMKFNTPAVSELLVILRYHLDDIRLDLQRTKLLPNFIADEIIYYERETYDVAAMLKDLSTLPPGRLDRESIYIQNINVMGNLDISHYLMKVRPGRTNSKD